MHLKLIGSGLLQGKTSSSCTKVLQEHIWDVWHAFASLDQYTRATLNAVAWNSELKWPNDLDSQGQWPLFSIPAESIPWCMIDANLVIPVHICDELLCRQSKVFHRWMERQTDATAITLPLQPKRPRGKTLIENSTIYFFSNDCSMTRFYEYFLYCISSFSCLYYLSTWTYIPIYVNSLRPSDPYICEYNIQKLVQMMACHLFGTKLFPEPMLPHCQLDLKNHISVIFYF